ncbi:MULTISPECIES: hypothetical protein [unclassified Arthrobacter]|uniref:hypothetical protein n=1 Tax=unclassified Arthrobacter TaxID=235627 RepID=UPI001D14DAD6|nr:MULTISPECIES: hypothetical protein [unclassified Arthrobacter]MCC3274467.1 hypothetical protein [Arthrobacter sp. zg-Y20]MCC3279540.1 hypothetical protein [Arthrobacter sp. zg-Y40]MCC9177940.1 hypothetical protein [Arthrobacter sp. zg-Y750]MDK1314624.1 hypothetical protein [Arthrobacter sp. zg.Y20]MDK1327509.1 hypothetical protein [Arthrobacter sp. zg-Y1143]
MTSTIVVLTEESLVPGDIENLRALAGDTPTRFEVLVPADPGRNLLVDVLDNLSLLEFSAAFKNLTGDRPSKADEVKAAVTELAESLELMQASGLEATGTVTGEEPVTAVVETAKRTQADQVVVITTPHAIEDTFRTDWANEAQDRLGVPVLHLYSGSGFIGDS